MRFFFFSLRNSRMRTEHPPGKRMRKLKIGGNCSYGLFAKQLRPMSTSAKVSVLNMQSKFVNDGRLSFINTWQ